MASKMAFVIKQDNIKEIIKEKNEAVEKAMVSCGLIMERYAQDLCPVQTGRLRNSITFATEKYHSSGGGSPAKAEDKALHGTPEVGSVYIGTNVEYAPYVELGSSKRKPKPYLKPSIQNHLNEYKDIIEKTLGK